MLLHVLLILGKGLLYPLTFTHTVLLSSGLAADAESTVKSEGYPSLATSCAEVCED